MVATQIASSAGGDADRLLFPTGMGSPTGSSEAGSIRVTCVVLRVRPTQTHFGDCPATALGRCPTLDLVDGGAFAPGDAGAELLIGSGRVFASPTSAASGDERKGGKRWQAALSSLAPPVRIGKR